MPMKPVSALSRAALLPLIAALTLSACTTGANTSERIPKAVFIIVDGIPPDVLEQTATPALDEISAEGAYARAYVGGAVGEASESPTISAVGYNSLLTGTWANKHNVWDNSIENPNYAYWDIFRVAKNDNPALVTAIFSTWTDNRTKLLGDGLEAAGGQKIDYHYDGFELDTERFPHDDRGDYIRQIDAVVVAEAARYIKDAGPDLSWIYLEHTDDVAHRFGDSPELSAAIRLVDSQIGAVWASIKQRRTQYNEDWLILVTTDHGRDAETGQEHGGQSDRERTTWIATNSQRLDDSFFQNPGIVDIMPSLADHLGLKIPEPVRAELDGKSFIR
jgi:predicted AlkP superfamily pyrophosphatase or phosphodiesterase